MLARAAMLRSRALHQFGLAASRRQSASPSDVFLRGLAIRGRPSQARNSPTSPTLNEDVARLPSVRLISESGDVQGEMSGRAAYEAAKRAGLDVLLVHSAPEGSPCVVRLIDYEAVAEASRRAEYAQRKKKKEMQAQTRKEGSLKQVRLSPATGERDFEMKMRQARRFLLDGHRVRVFMQFRRGQGRLQQNAKLSLSNAATALTEIGTLAGRGKQKIKNDGASGTSVDELFPKPEPEEEGQMVATETKAKPLEVVILPLGKKERDRLRDSGAEPLSDDVGRNAGPDAGVAASE